MPLPTNSHSMPTTTIQDLPEDVLVRILGFCDICAVISTSEVNRDLRRIALTKQLWIQIINDLIYRSLLELPADFVVSEHSSTGLIEHVERAVKDHGRGRLRPTSLPRRKNHVLPVKIIRGYKGKTKIVLAHGNLVEIWDVTTKAASGLVLLVLMTFLSTNRVFIADYSGMVLRDRHTLEIAQVDVQPSIVGNLVIVQLLLDGVRETLLLDWFARRYVLLTDFRAPIPCARMISKDYLVIATGDPYIVPPPQKPGTSLPLFQTQVLLYSVDAFATFWRPLDGLNTPAVERITLAALIPLVVESPEIDNQHFHDATISLSVRESPLHPGTFRILNKRHPRMSGTAAMFCYTCRGGRDAHEWRLESAHPAQPSMQFHSFSYAGQAVDDRNYELYAGAGVMMLEYMGRLARTPPGCVWQDLSPYSGVVTSVVAEEVVVAYYS
ncbi:hypothetical protein B0H13DRAFT_2063521 [Mycena leptocephala]|nr:hypothetical protein B0H13DRAFT_2063521 [Mycena leptocephala]